MLSMQPLKFLRPPEMGLPEYGIPPKLNCKVEIRPLRKKKKSTKKIPAQIISENMTVFTV